MARKKTAEEKILEYLDQTTNTAYAVALFALKKQEERLNELSPGKLVGERGRLLGYREGELMKICKDFETVAKRIEALVGTYGD